MEQQTFTECFDYMTKFHKFEPSATVRAAWWASFENEHDDIFCKAMMLHNEKQAPGRFPTLERFRQYVADAREKAWHAKKAEAPKSLRDYQPPAGDRRNVERGKRWIEGIIAICEGRKRADELIAEMGSGENANGY